MEKHQKGPRDSKIVYFPNLTGKLVNKGMSALKQKKFKDSLNFFQQLIEMEPDHPQGNVGVVLSLVELGQLEEAKLKCDEILKKDIGEYYDVLQIYISILIQLGDYEEVVDILEAVIQEQTVPAHMAENFYQLLYFSRKMAEEDQDHSENFYEMNADMITESDLERISHQLKSPDSKLQWQAVQSIESVNHPVIREELKKFLTYTEANPSLKTIVLQMMKDGNIPDTLEIHKFGKTLTIHTNELIDIPDGQFYRLVKKIVSHQLEHENPTLLEMAIQIWDHYLFMLYPFQPEPLNEQLWATAILEVSHRLNGLDFDGNELQDTFSLQEEAVEQAVEKILEIERISMKDIGFSGNHPNG